jgi:tol-pal system protein YbgF
MKHSLVLLSALLAVSMSGCLKTRAQLNQDRDEDTRRPQPAHVEEVKPQGQYVIDEIKSEMTRLQGRVEDLERSQKESGQASNRAHAEEMKKLEGRIVELEQAQANMLEELKKVRDNAQANADPNEAFEKAKASYDSKQYDAAIDGFTLYLKNSKAKRAEEAHFFRGESFFQLKQYKKAIVDYSKFPEKYTSSKRLPDALYKIGLSFDALGMKSDAQGFFAEVVEKFPKSAEAKKAKTKLR